jgi:hypothetical protein
MKYLPLDIIKQTNNQSINQSINQISEVKFLGNFCLLLHRSTLGDLSNYEISATGHYKTNQQSINQSINQSNI